MRRPIIFKAKPGDIRVWNIINPPSEPVYYPVNSVDHAKQLKKALADSQLLMQEIESNVFGIEVFRDGEWQEMENEDEDN